MPNNPFGGFEGLLGGLEKAEELARQKEAQHPPPIEHIVGPDPNAVDSDSMDSGQGFKLDVNTPEDSIDTPPQVFIFTVSFFLPAHLLFGADTRLT
jgi:hypothetical protein